jgi:hypothetical protein
MYLYINAERNIEATEAAARVIFCVVVKNGEIVFAARSLYRA